MSQGPPRGGRATFQRLDTNPRWAGIPDLDDAGPRAIRSYLRTYGPATPAHLHYWLGNGLSAGRRRIDRWLDELGDQVVAVDVDGTTALVVRADVDDLTAATPSEEVRLLPGHDQWVMGPGTADEHVTPPPLRAVVTRKASLVVVGGVLRGTWRLRGDDLAVHWLDDPPRSGVALAREAARLEELLGRTLRLDLG